MPKKVIFTEEERQLDLKDTEEMIRDNLSYSKIASELGRTTTYISNLKKKLINTNKITQEEIDELKKQAREEREALLDAKVHRLLKDGYNKTKIGQTLDESHDEIDKSIKRLKDSGVNVDQYQTEEEKLKEERKKKIKALVKKGGYYPYKISKETGIPNTTTVKLIDELIASGEIKESMLNQDNAKQINANKKIYTLADSGKSFDFIAKECHMKPEEVERIIRKRNQNKKSKKKIRSNNSNVKEIDEHLTIKEVRLIELLKSGYGYSYISKKLKEEHQNIMDMKNKLIKERYITQAIINEARANREIYYIEQIKQLTEAGYSQIQIFKILNPDNIIDIQTGKISQIVKKLIEEGKINEDTMSQAQDNMENSAKSIENKVYNCLIDGLLVEEMLEKEEFKNITYHQVMGSRKRLIDSGRITLEQIKNYQELKKQRELEEVEDTIFSYIINEGLSVEEIAKEVDHCADYVTKKIQGYKKRHNLTTTDVNNIRKKALKRIAIQKAKITRIIKKKDEAKDNIKNKYDSGRDFEKDSFIYYEQIQLIINENIEFSKDDIDILSFIVLYNEELFNINNLKLVIKLYICIKEYEEALNYLNQFYGNYGNRDEVTNYYLSTKKKIKELNKKHGKM